MTLEVNNLVAGYGDIAILDKVSFRIADGQILAFFGHNGAGKSTTLKAVLGLIPAREGEIILDGERIGGLSITDRLRRGLRIMPEGRGVFPDLSVEDNIEVVARQVCPRTGSKISVSDVYDLLPVLKDRRKTIVGEMSGGQQQMLAFGLVLLGSPKCFLLEEPSVGLQPDLVEALFAKMSEICRSLAISAILVEHRIASALLISDHVIIIKSGRIVFNDSAEVARRTDFWPYF